MLQQSYKSLHGKSKNRRYKNMTQMDVYKMEGISNLPMTVRRPFGQAWYAEYNGETEKSLELLDEAIEAESALAANSKK